MLYLAIRLDDHRYALGATLIVEVLPLVNIRRLPQSRPAVAGVILYRGTPIPVIDLSELLLGRPAHRRLNTRLVVVRRPLAGGEQQLMGLIVEGATQTFRFDGQGTVLGGISTADGAAGIITVDQQSLIQQLDLTKLVPFATQDGLDQASLAW